MKKLIIIFLLSVGLLYANVGKVINVKGDVEILRASKSLPAEVGMVLQLQDEIKTKNLSKALIMMNDKTTITIGKNSQMAISEFVYDENVKSKNKASFGFGKGVFRTITGQIGKLNKNQFKIKTKSASIGIRGTVFDVAVDEKTTKVGVIDGGVYYEDLKSSQVFDVSKNQKLTYDETTGDVSIQAGTLIESNDIEEDEKELQGEESEEKQETESKEEKEEQKSEESEEEQEEQKTEEEQEAEEEQEEQKTEEEQETKEEQKSEEESPKEENKEQKPQEKQDNNAPIKEQNSPPEDKEIISVDDPIQEEEIFVLEETNAQPVLDVVVQNIQEVDEIIEEVQEIVETAITQVKDTVAIDATTITQNPLNDNPISNIDDQIKAITHKIMNTSSNSYLEFGHIADKQTIDGVDTLVPTGEYYITGDITPTEVIQDYINDQNTISYEGSLSTLIDDVQKVGEVDLVVDFGTQNFTGSMSIEEGSILDATINSGSVTSSGISTTDITGTTNVGDITSGSSLDGKFYGPDGDSVGGNFDIKSGSSSINGVYGATEIQD